METKWIQISRILKMKKGDNRKAYKLTTEEGKVLGEMQPSKMGGYTYSIPGIPQEMLEGKGMVRKFPLPQYVKTRAQFKSLCIGIEQDREKWDTRLAEWITPPTKFYALGMPIKTENGKIGYISSVTIIILNDEGEATWHQNIIHHQELVKLTERAKEATNG